jgi:opacity protein-like surface antigen
MKKVFFVIVAVLAMSAAASAQVPNPISLYFGGAISFPTAPDAFSEGYNTGWHGTAGVGYKFAPNFQVIGKIEYHRFSVDYDNDPLLATANIDGGQNNMWMFGADARYAFGLPAAPVTPYVIGGLGLANISFSEFDGVEPLATSLNDAYDGSQTDLYFNLGAGAELKTGPLWSLFAQIRYVSVQTEGDAASFVPFTLGVKFF